MKIQKILSLSTLAVLVLFQTSAYSMYEEEHNQWAAKSKKKQKKYSSSADSSSEEKSSSHLSSSSETSDSSEATEDLASFLNIGESSWPGSISVNGLSYQDWLGDSEAYEAMLQKSAHGISHYVRKGFRWSHFNKYSVISFSNCMFDRELLDTVGIQLSAHNHVITKAHFYECHFKTQKLRKRLADAAGFTQASTFLNCTEGKDSKPIPNSNTTPKRSYKKRK
jgi:hypothetical protein